MNIKDKIKQIKYHRLKPEEKFLMESFINLIEYVHDDYPNQIFYVKNHRDLLFEWNRNAGIFGCGDEIWKILNLLNLEIDESKILIKKLIKSYLKVKNVKIDKLKVIPSYSLLSEMKPKGVIKKYTSWDDFK